ncbi:GEVED domain-containing protein [Pseudoalteromonas sp. MMG012]|uniref:GEVED domain-containing protein n=1 Tax=Pseudoalteromonas sp. MMG012 TaxID=2822686 RepID=UPI001B3A275D|nr:GEVED domain-containing protein [Pseudoalteromonas sp. MMG012]MBQ4850580.1 dihydroxy-acid dehydratase [Pseudoalteromonas sp. MMG012]
MIRQLIAASLLMCIAATVQANTESETSANYNELGDLLTVQQAQGRFAWLEKCYDGLLVEVWERAFDTTDIISKEQKLAQLRALWLSPERLAQGHAQYLTFANSDFTNPYNWHAGANVADACSTMPPEYVPVALKTTILKNSYCDNVAFDSEWEWIDKVTLDDFSHDSARHSYTAVSGKVITLSAGREASMTITPGNKEPQYPSYVAARVWVDWDQDGQFSDSEMVYKSASDGVFKFAISVPTEQPEGVTLMRVATDSGGGSDNACNRIHYGEVEDYLVTIR